MKKLFSIWKKIVNRQSSIVNIRRGFTLVELLIVIVIIGALTTLLMANFIGVRQRARDAQRKSDLRQIQSALELYRSDQGSYSQILPNCQSSIKSPDCATSTYMQTVPKDPMGSSYYNSGNYFFSSNGTVYTLGVCLENKSDSQGAGTSPGGSGCSSDFYYVLNNP
ncbi:MAG: prepilin-type N-terminal cleavage/methylation domain-containing protein [Candidatus Levyibacteriota bacterium]